MTLRERIAKGFKATLVSRIIYAAANGALLLVLTRYLLDPDQYGLLYFAVSVVGVAELFGTLGLTKATARYVNEYLETDDTQVRHIIRWSLVAVLGMALTVTALVSATSGPLASLLNRPEVAPVLTVGGLYVAGRAFVSYQRSVFQAFNAVAYSAVLTAINSLVRLCAAVGLVLAGYGVIGAMAGYVIGFLTAAAFGFVFLYVRFYRRLPATEDAETGLRRRLLRYSVPTTATRASVVLDSKIDTVLVGMLATPAAVAFYTLARQIADLCNVPAQSLGYAVTPTLGEQSAADNRDRAANIYEQSLRNILLLYVPAAAGLAVVAEPTVRYVVGPEYLGAVPLIQLYGVFIVLRAIEKITANTLDLLGLARIRAMARGVSAVSNVGLNIALIPPLGALGAGIATVITYAGYVMVNIYSLHQELPFDAPSVGSHLARVTAIAAVMAGVVLTALPYVGGLVTLAGAIVVGGGVWAGLSVASGLLEPRAVLSFIS